MGKGSERGRKGASWGERRVNKKEKKQKKSGGVPN